MNVTNLVFDIGNVLLDLDIPSAQALLVARRRADLSEEAFLSAVTPVVHAFECGNVDSDVFVEQVLVHCQPGTEPSVIQEIWNDMLLTIPAYRLGMLTALRERFNLFALSNTNALHLERFHQHLETAHGITDFEKAFFDEVYYSHLLGMRKPDPKIYRHVIEDALITPKRTLYIDDSSDCIEAARKLGFQTMHSSADHEVAEALKLLGYY